MRKRLTLFLLMLLCTQAAFAALPEDVWTSRPLPGCAVLLSLPERCHVLTRSMPEDDPDLLTAGLTTRQNEERMTGALCYLDALDPKLGYGIILRIMPSEGKDFRLFNDLQVKAHATDLKRRYKAQGLTMETVEVWRTEADAWLVMQSVTAAGDGAFVEALTRRDDLLYAFQVTYAPDSEGAMVYLRNLLESVTIGPVE